MELDVEAEAGGIDCDEGRQPPEGAINGVLQFGVPGGVPPWLSGYDKGEGGSGLLISLLCLDVRFRFFLTSPKNLFRSCSSQNSCLDT